MNNALSTRIEQLERTVGALNRELERTKAVHEIENVMSRYSYWHTAHMHHECLGLFALDTPGVRAEMVWGVYDGRKSVELLYAEMHPWMESKNVEGRMHMHPMTTPVIEVAEDLRTAKGVWISPGQDTFVMSEGQPLNAYWVWIKYGCDFVLENGRWKIWHLHVYPIFFSPFEKSWVSAPRFSGSVGRPDRFKPDRPPTTNTFWGPDRIYQNVPAPPDPFKTFDERTGY